MKLSKNDKKGLAIFGVVFVVAIAIFIGPVFIDKQQFDEETLCPVDILYPQTVFLVDTTDTLDGREQRNLIGELEDVKDSLAEFERFSIYLISEDIGGLSDPLFDKCRPPTGANANKFIESPRLIRQRYEKEFGDKLDEIIQSLPTNESANHSPIIESLADVANRIRRNTDKWSSVRVLIFSDMMQHTADWSHYSGAGSMDFERFQKSRLGTTMMMDFNRTDVEVFYLLRPATPNPELHRKFWTSLLSSANANMRWVPIS